MAGVEAQLDPGKSTYCSFWGRKGSGKSELARFLFMSYPYDRLVIDPTHDVDLGDEKVDELQAPLPVRWPARADNERSTLHYKPDAGSATYDDDLDRAVGLAYNHRRSLLWIDEGGELGSAHKTGPWFRRVLKMGRHRDLSLFVCDPRPVNVNPLILAQSDFVYVFDLPNPRDRERVAEMIGWDPKAFHDAVLGLPPHAYLRYDARAEDDDDRLIEFPPLPRSALTRH
jgi:hypothetical protein